MKRDREYAAWKAFWERQRNTSAPGVVSQEWSEITRAQFDAWTGFARHLPNGARVLDLATGNGKLIEMLQAVRNDISPTGIDLAPELPPAPEGAQLIGDVRMENLPFEDDNFDAVVSQFGFEYGETSKVAHEILRVLKGNGPIGLMVHRGDGPILAHNLARKTQIEWVRQRRRLFKRVKEMLPDQGTVAPEAIAFATEVCRAGAEKFGPYSAAWEIPEAVRRTLLLAPKGSRQKLLDTLALIEGQADNELGRIASLADACSRADARDRLIRPFLEMGRETKETLQVRDSQSRVFAHLLIF